MAEIEVNFSSTGKLDKIKLEEVKWNIGAKIRSIEFDFTVKGKISVNQDCNTHANQSPNVPGQIIRTLLEHYLDH